MIEINVKIDDKKGQEWNAESGDFKKAGKTKLETISSLFSEIEKKNGYKLELWSFIDTDKKHIIAFFSEMKTKTK